MGERLEQRLKTATHQRTEHNSAVPLHFIVGKEYERLSKVGKNLFIIQEYFGFLRMVSGSNNEHNKELVSNARIEV